MCDQCILLTMHASVSFESLSNRFPVEFEKLSPPILQLDEVEFYYAKEKPIFKKIDISATMESRTCIVSTTLLSKSLHNIYCVWKLN